MKLRAFTLIETILYLSLFNIIFFVVITWAISIAQNNKTAEYKNAIEKNAIFISEHLNDSFSKGLTIDQANSTFNNANGKVRVTFTSGYFEYYRASDVLTVTNGTTTYSLTDKFVKVTNFSIVPVIAQSSTVVGARISMTLVAEKYPNISKTIESYYDFR